MITEIENQIIAALQTVYDNFGWIGVAGLMAVENAIGITPSEIILGLAGWLLLAAHDASPGMILIGGLYGAIGSVVGASVTYWSLRLGGRPVLNRVARWIGIDSQYIHRAEKIFNRWGPGLILIGRVVPGLRTLITIPAGLSRMPYPQFLFFTFIGAYVWCSFIIGIGYVFGHQWSVISEYYQNYTPWVLLGIIALYGMVWMVRRFTHRRLSYPQSAFRAYLDKE